MTFKGDMSLTQLLRPNVASLTPYRSARDEYTELYDSAQSSSRSKDATTLTLLDANENSFGSPCAVSVNRYPDPYQRELRAQIAAICQVAPGQVVVGNGSDELIDLLIRALVRPSLDQVWVTVPSYGMYEVCAELQQAEIKTIKLTSSYDLPMSEWDFDVRAKICFLCSPNNPTGNLLCKDAVLHLISRFPGIVVVDEAYIDFSLDPGFTSELDRFSRLVVLRTFSKAWGLAGARIGVGLMNPVLREAIDRIKPPYNLGDVAAQCALSALCNANWTADVVKQLIAEREFMTTALSELDIVEKVFPSEANFLLVRVKRSDDLHSALLKKGIVVRNRNTQEGCKQCLRFTIGTREENINLLAAIKQFSELVRGNKGIDGYE